MHAVHPERMPGRAAHRIPVDLDRLFPIRDAASAWFMQFKAHCLLRAGVISRAEKAEVDAAAARALMQAAREPAGPPAHRRVA